MNVLLDTDLRGWLKTELTYKNLVPSDFQFKQILQHLIQWNTMPQLNKVGKCYVIRRPYSELPTKIY